MLYDVVIVGGGPAGLAATLALGRGRKRVLLCDSGPRRNAAAVHVQNFVTRDGTPPTEFRRIGREQLAHYPNVEVRDLLVDQVAGDKGAFEVSLIGDKEKDVVRARRVLLCTGLVDQMMNIDGFAAHWGTSIYQCPYCHGWEIQDGRFGVIVPNVEMLEYALLLRGWTSSLVVLTNGAALDIPAEMRARLDRARVTVEPRRIKRLVGSSSAPMTSKLAAVELEDGASIPLETIFARPPQKQVSIVESLVLRGLTLDPQGFVQVSDHRETSIPGIFAGGDLITPMQSAIIAAAAGMQAAAFLNHELTVELASSGELA